MYVVWAVTVGAVNFGLSNVVPSKWVLAFPDHVIDSKTWSPNETVEDCPAHKSLSSITIEGVNLSFTVTVIAARSLSHSFWV